MNCNFRWRETTKRNGLLNPKNNVVSCTPLVISKIVV